jgi:hypothetical protein
MGLTNAEKQARWRQRREERIKALEQRIAELEAENERLRDRSPGRPAMQKREAASRTGRPRRKRRSGGPKDIPVNVGVKRKE